MGPDLGAKTTYIGLQFPPPLFSAKSEDYFHIPNRLVKRTKIAIALDEIVLNPLRGEQSE